MRRSAQPTSLFTPLRPLRQSLTPIWRQPYLPPLAPGVLPHHPRPGGASMANDGGGTGRRGEIVLPVGSRRRSADGMVSPVRPSRSPVSARLLRLTAGKATNRTPLRGPGGLLRPHTYSLRGRYTSQTPPPSRPVWLRRRQTKASGGGFRGKKAMRAMLEWRRTRHSQTGGQSRWTRALVYSAAGSPRFTNPSGSLAAARARSSASVASRWRFHIWA